MNKEQQRIAIAEACGWKPNPFEMDMCGQVFPQSPPDYPNDLNAMHEAEKVLNYEQLADMAEFIGVDADQAPADSWNILLRATAAQRAEAFLRTINKWEEEDSK